MSYVDSVNSVDSVDSMDSMDSICTDSITRSQKNAHPLLPTHQYLTNHGLMATDFHYLAQLLNFSTSQLLTTPPPPVSAKLQNPYKTTTHSIFRLSMHRFSGRPSIYRCCRHMVSRPLSFSRRLRIHPIHTSTITGHLAKRNNYNSNHFLLLIFFNSPPPP